MDTKANMQKKAQDGSLVNRPPFGYVVVRAVEVVPDEKRLVKKIFRLATRKWKVKNNGYANIASEVGLNQSRVRSILNNPFYYGKIRFAGKLFDGKHEPIISKRTFVKAQKVIRQRMGRYSIEEKKEAIEKTNQKIFANCLRDIKLNNGRVVTRESIWRWKKEATLSADEALKMQTNQQR